MLLFFNKHTDKIFLVLAKLS